MSCLCSLLSKKYAVQCFICNYNCYVLQDFLYMKDIPASILHHILGQRYRALRGLHVLSFLNIESELSLSVH
jgi:hypothetical protein